MTEQNYPSPPTGPAAPMPPYGAPQPPMAPYGAPVMTAYGPGPIGKTRSTGLCVLLTIVTFGIYSLVWFYMVHDEMKRHRGQGVGGLVALVVSFFVTFVMAFITSEEVGALYEARGQVRPVSAVTGLWYFPGMFILVGPLIWFVKTNGALNAYWRTCGAV